ncbi:MAG: sigma-70 family polymerase sigma factor [Marmoricola sp.]|nr:sigma-70 family polymerase sigma factor [Marmoricola sp.]
MSDDDLDNDLVRAAQAGQDHASAFLVSRFGPRVLGYCRSIATDLTDVDHERIVELAIENAVRKIDRFDPNRGKFGTWIRTFVLHAVQDWRRGHARLVSLDDEERRISEPATDAVGAVLTEANLTTTTEEGPSEHVRQLVAAVNEALPKLRTTDQLIITMRDIEGRSVEETAASLKIRPDACRQRHHRARVRLMDVLRSDPRCAIFLPGDTA